MALSTTARDRFRSQHRPLSLGGGNASSCPEAVIEAGDGSPPSMSTENGSVKSFKDARHRTGCPDGTPIASRCLSFSKSSFESCCFRGSDTLPGSGRAQAPAPRNRIRSPVVRSIVPLAADPRSAACHRSDPSGRSRQTPRPGGPRAASRISAPPATEAPLPIGGSVPLFRTRPVSHRPRLTLFH